LALDGERLASDICQKWLKNFPATFSVCFLRAELARLPQTEVVHCYSEGRSLIQRNMGREPLEDLINLEVYFYEGQVEKVFFLKSSHLFEWFDSFV